MAIKDASFKERLRSGQRLYGTCIVSTSPRWLDYVGCLGLDLVFLDTEHIAIDREKLSWMCHAYRGLGLTPIVRIPSPDPFQATMAIDGGAVGVVGPYLERPEQVRALVGAVHYRPLRHSKLNRALEGTKRLGSELDDYCARFNRGQVFIANIESEAAIESLDQILSVEGLDGVLVGPHDLSCSLGVPEQFDHPRFEEAVRFILAAARSKGIGAGIHSWFGIEREIEWIKAGANLIIHSLDVSLFALSIRERIRCLREQFGDTREDDSRT